MFALLGAFVLCTAWASGAPYGAGGNDTLDGGKGNDKLFGGSGVNSHKGGVGDDTVSARNKKKDTIDCGAGRKDKATVDKIDKVKGCEKVARK